jgi:catechol 2,3-dioxygenase-like lactoylglutathione lyase family enzyme
VNAVRRTTSAVASSVLCWEVTPDHTPIAYADPVLGDGYAAALEEVFRHRDVEDLAVPDEYEVTIHRDIVSEALADPVLEPLYPYLENPVWRDASIIPLVVSGVQVGELAVFLAAGQDLHADERAYLRALADQAAVAVRNGTLFRAAERTAGLEERHRLARDLHDSVSQALFSMTLHARTAQRHLVAAGLEQDSPVAVEPAGGMGESARSLGFLVADLDEAVAKLKAVGIETDTPTANELERYVHFTAPDGHLYELVERL